MDVPDKVAFIGGQACASIGVDGAGNLTVYRIEHEFTQRSPSSVIESARRNIDPLLQLIQFRSHLSDVVKDTVATLHSETGEPLGGGTLRDATLVATAVVTNRFSVPTTEDLESHERLQTWLILWNMAHSSKSAIESIRNCYMICEDMDSRTDSRFMPLKYTRDFVSHAEVDSPKLLDFLKLQFGEETTRFNPVNSRHISFVAEQRMHAMVFSSELIERKIARGPLHQEN